MIDPLPSRWRRARLVIVRPSGTPVPHSINEVVTSLFYGLQSLGCSVDIEENEPIEDGTNIFFRAHLLPLSRVSEMPPGSIVYNFEQIFERSPWVGSIYRDLLSRSTVWDYSRRNLAAIGSIADRRHLHLVPLGYMPQLTRIPPAPVEDIDVLFYGVLNQRRLAILRALEQAGLRVQTETRIRADARDALISRTKLVLNLHFYPTAIFEIVRVSYLLANRKAVVGECGPDTEIDSDIREAIAPASYDRLCNTVLELLRDDGRRLDLARRGHEIFASRRLPDILAQAIAETEAATRSPAVASRASRAGTVDASTSKAEPVQRGGAILMYHDAFGDDRTDLAPSPYNVPPEVLAAQLGWLKDNFDIVDVDSWLSSKDRRGKVAITFDDGYTSAFSAVVPVLESLGITATFFVIGALLEGQVYWRDRVHYLEQTGLVRRFVDWLPATAAERGLLSAGRLHDTSKDTRIDSLQLMRWLEQFYAEAGIVIAPGRFATAATLPDSRHLVFGSHSYSHPILASLTDEETRADLRRNRAILQNLALSRARKTNVFAMPFGTLGTYHERTLRILAEEAHPQILMAASINPSFASRAAIELAPRLIVPPSVAALQAKMASRLPPPAAPGRAKRDSEPTAKTPQRKRILFYAINGNGLGHVVRLSVIAHAIKDHADIAFYSTSRFADQYCPGRIFTIDDRLDDRFELNPEQRTLLGFHLALNKFSPDVVVCDTHWPHTIVSGLHESGVRTILVLRSLAIEKMESAMSGAIRDFTSVLIPHHPTELENIYRSRPDLVERMVMAPCACIGPIARTAAHPSSERSVIFTLGGGGEYWNWTQADSVDRFIGEYRSVAATIADRFGMEPVFAAGPLLDRPDDSLHPFKVVRSQNLHEMFGPETIVVTRGGYNTCWEAIAAGARLIIVGKHNSSRVEDVDTRACFLAAEGLATYVETDASEILKACTKLIERPFPVHDHYLRRSINGGLSVARDDILGRLRI
jgi:peptidoglycan/xylan/chitin deacetylase (PgdA/CDA1 family)